MTQTFSASVTRTALGLDVLDLSASPYTVTAFSEGTSLWRRDEVASPWVEGTIEVHAVRDAAESTLTVLVTGTDEADLEANVDALVAAFEQAAFTVTLQVGNGTRTFDGREADWQTGWTWGTDAAPGVGREYTAGGA